MTLESFAEVPVFSLPDGFTMRTYLNGDEHSWLSLQKRADLYNQFDESTFSKQFGAKFEQLANRQLYVEKSGEVIGTSTAWSDDLYWGDPSGRIRWVAVQPECQGLGIGKALVSATIDRFRLFAETRSYLWTRTLRLPAIRLYLDFGFRPGIRTAEDHHVWAALIKEKLPTEHTLIQWLKDFESGTSSESDIEVDRSVLLTKKKAP